MSERADSIKIQIMTAASQWCDSVFSIMQASNRLDQRPYKETIVNVKWDKLELALLDGLTQTMAQHIASTNLPEGDVRIRAEAATLTVGVWEKSARAHQGHLGRYQNAYEKELSAMAHRKRTDPRVAGLPGSDKVVLREADMMEIAQAMLTPVLNQIDTLCAAVGSVLDEETIVTGPSEPKTDAAVGGPNRGPGR